ncbi:hypothetical protein Dip518_000026 [Parelusimicrobium proximum]|uniref:LptA/OstA family protein n=1 Tax=Parelusimicrobium proximum TaxID=3228953 RepID=UPI003D17C3B3
MAEILRYVHKAFLPAGILCMALSFVHGQKIPDGILGGIVKSDRWLIKKDAQQEEFIGNVSYDTPKYKLKADRALSDRKNNIFTLNGRAYLMHKTDKGAVSELTGDKIVFNNNTGKGTVTSAKAPVSIIYTLPDYKIEADSRKADFNIKKETADLTDNVRIKYTTDEDFLLLFSDKAFFNRRAERAVFMGNVDAATSAYSILAGKAVADNLSNTVVFEERRPVATADVNNTKMALQSDKISIDTAKRKISAHGSIRGWIQPEEDFTGINFNTL